MRRLLFLLVAAALIPACGSDSSDSAPAPVSNAAVGTTLDGTSIAQVSGDIWILIITGIVMVPLGLGIFHIAEVYAKKTGLLKRSG